MSAVTASPAIEPHHRLELTLFVAAALHAMVILGVGFGLEDRLAPDELTRMEVTLVHSRSDQAPEKADFLAQANQQGGGEAEEPARPTSPAATPHMLPSRGTDALTQPQEPAAPERQAQQQVLTASTAPTRAPSKPSEEAAPKAPNAAQLMRRSLEMASLSAEINRDWRTAAQRPRRKYISASTKEYKYASYEEAWRLKVERIGNLNYPDEAKRDGLSGALMLDVAIKADGSISAIKLLRSSGHRVLDDAAQRIVWLAAPFAPFPASIRRETDVLHIIRTWKFESDYRLSSTR